MYVYNGKPQLGLFAPHGWGAIITKLSLALQLINEHISLKLYYMAYSSNFPDRTTRDPQPWLCQLYEIESTTLYYSCDRGWSHCWVPAHTLQLLMNREGVCMWFQQEIPPFRTSLNKLAQIFCVRWQVLFALILVYEFARDAPGKQPNQESRDNPQDGYTKERDI